MSQTAKPGSKVLRKGRFSQTNGIYFITSGTDQRIPWFQDHGLARLISKQVNRLSSFTDAESLCWVVMPDHFHLLLKLGDNELSEVVRRFKARSARILNQEIGRKGRFWGPGFHDHGLRREEDLKEISRYIVANPLRAGMVNKVGNYPYWNAVWF